MNGPAASVETEAGHASVTLALTGASGAVYGLRLLACLLQAGRGVRLLLSDAARVVMEQECGLVCRGDGAAVVDSLAVFYRGAFYQERFPGPLSLAGVRHHGLHDWGAPMASGSVDRRAMVICPCSMGTLAAVAHGLSDSLIERAADVALKERWPLVLVPREAPLSSIHLENMLRLSRAGAILLPAAPGFYHRPQTVGALVDFVVARVLDQLRVPHRLLPRGPDGDGNWGGAGSGG